MKRYTEPILSTPQRLAALTDRGLIINDCVRAERYLNNVGYFRLSGYMGHLQDTNHSFIENVSFEEIISLYQFDKKLRAVIVEYLERIEVAVRAKLSNKFTLKYGFFWYLEHSLFADKERFTYIKKNIKETFDGTQEGFLYKFKRNYPHETFPPSAMALEILSFGKLANLYSGLNNNVEKGEIASEFNLVPNILTSWLVYLATVRNVCAHHARLWNIKITANQPVIPNRDKFKFKGAMTTDFNTTMYGIASMINRLLFAINPTNSFIQKIENLIKDYSIDTNLMGFPVDWKTNAHWYKENTD